MRRDQVIEAARAIREQRYSSATVVLAAGSLMRGEGTAYSDLDLVVLHPSMPNAFRESFIFDRLPVEAFVHDLETLGYFFLEVDRPSGAPSLARMVAEGIEIPAPNDMSRSAKDLAASVLAMGPPSLSSEEERKRRYGITDLLDDLRSPRSRGEALGTGSELFGEAADYYLRTRGLWSARGKSIPRALAHADADLCGKYCEAFEKLFAGGDVDAVIGLVEELLEPHGGPLFEGHRLDAPSDWRSRPPK